MITAQFQPELKISFEIYSMKKFMDSKIHMNINGGISDIDINFKESKYCIIQIYTSIWCCENFPIVILYFNSYHPSPSFLHDFQS